MNDIVGYVWIKSSTTGISAAPIDEFLNVPLRVMEFADDGVMVIHPKGEAIATFDNVDVHQRFECHDWGNVICPPGLSHMERIAYSTRCLSRKGGYCEVLRKMVILASLHKGTFTDDFLWQLQ
jgi:hypothetical protein